MQTLYSKDTLVLTGSGWVKIQDIKPYQTIASYDIIEDKVVYKNYDQAVVKTQGQSTLVSFRNVIFGTEFKLVMESKAAVLIEGLLDTPLLSELVGIYNFTLRPFSHIDPDKNNHLYALVVGCNKYDQLEVSLEDYEGELYSFNIESDNVVLGGSLPNQDKVVAFLANV